MQRWGWLCQTSPGCRELSSTCGPRTPCPEFLLDPLTAKKTRNPCVNTRIQSLHTHLFETPLLLFLPLPRLPAVDAVSLALGVLLPFHGYTSRPSKVCASDARPLERGSASCCNFSSRLLQLCAYLSRDCRHVLAVAEKGGAKVQQSHRHMPRECKLCLRAV